MSTPECLGDPVLCGCSLDALLLRLLEELTTLRESQAVLNRLVADLATVYPDLAQRADQARLHVNLDSLLREQDLARWTYQQLQSLSISPVLHDRSHQQLELLDREIKTFRCTLTG